MWKDIIHYKKNRCLSTSLTYIKNRYISPFFFLLSFFFFNDIYNIKIKNLSKKTEDSKKKKRELKKKRTQNYLKKEIKQEKEK